MAQRKEGASANTPERREYADAWAAADEAADSHLANAFEKTSAMFEAKAAWLLARHLPKETPVFVAGSMPVRDAEYFGRPVTGATDFTSTGAPMASTGPCRPRSESRTVADRLWY
jgi:2-succinyl-5-enolpyruvyl-6-hydroxy-3-cyclohexene-1-carboxylate synthase